MNADQEQKLKDIVVERLGVSADKVVPSARFAEDLKADSLDLVELIMKLEEDFGIDIPDDQAEKILTVQDAMDFIDKNGKN